MTTGVLTGASKTDSFGGVANVHPMLRGLLTLSYVLQDTDRDVGANNVSTSGLNLPPQNSGLDGAACGHQIQASNPVALSSEDTIWTGLAGMTFVLNSRTRADADYYHEIRTRSNLGIRTTDRWTAGLSYALNHFSSATFGFDHSYRRDTNILGNIHVNELRLGIKLMW